MQMTIILPIVGIVALVAAAAIRAARTGSSLPAGAHVAFGWAPAFLAYPVFALAWSALGLYEGQDSTVALLVAVSCVCGIASMWRWNLAALLARRPRPKVARAVRDVIVLVVAVYLSFLALELPWNAALAQMDPLGACLELSMIALSMLALYFLCQRRGAGAALLSAALTVIGFAQSLVLLIKGTVIMPSDVLSLGTAAAVSENFKLTLGDPAFQAATLQCVATCLLSLLVPLPQEGAREHAKRHTEKRMAAAAGQATRHSCFASVVLNLVLTAACAAGAWFMAVGFSYNAAFGLELSAWWPSDTYQSEGFLTSFMMVVQDMPIREPQGYSQEAVAQAQQDLEAQLDDYDSEAQRAKALTAAQQQFQDLKPSVVCVMNESFSDLSRLDGLRCGYEGPAFFDSVDDALLRGTLDVSVRGGGTCNTEFEFLTGVSMAYVGTGKYPYSIYDMDGVPAIAQDFRQLGYKTSAMHPNQATNWRRNQIYPEYGFDRTLFIDDFEGAPTFHSGVSDAATYQKILDLLAEDDSPQFIFDVTMQNHLPYNANDIPEDLRVSCEPPGLAAEDAAQTSECLSCIQASDKDLEWFVGQLRELDRPVVLVFFGDHQPSISETLNDALYTQDATVLEHEQRTYQSDYLIWANYDVAGNDQRSQTQETSACYLGAVLKQSIGAPLTDFQRAELGASLSMPSVSLMGYLAPDGTWQAAEPGTPSYHTWQALELLTYRQFGSRVG